MSLTLSEETLQAMVALLDDTDEGIIRQITHDLLLQGTNLVPRLEAYWESTQNELVQNRLEQIIHKVQHNQLKADLKNWVSSTDQPLLEGVILINRHKYPNLNTINIRMQIESMRIETWLELRYELTALEKIRILSHIIYKVHGFSGTTDNYTDPSNSYLNQVMEKKNGNALSLSIVYTLIAQKLGFPIYGVDLPQHFILCYLDDRFEALQLKPEDREVLFYINPLNNGMPFQKKEINEFLKLMKIEPTERFFRPCSNLDIINRVLNNLINSYAERSKSDVVADLISLRNIVQGKDQEID